MQINSDGGIVLPRRSIRDRIVPISSKGHFSGSFVWDDDGPGTVANVESHTEMKWGLILETDSSIVTIEEQVLFHWFDEKNGPAKHYFDFVGTKKNGDEVAFAVKPTKRLESGHFLREIGQIAYQAKASGFVTDVRLLTDTDIDPVRIHNAKMLHAVRHADEPADRAAKMAIAKQTGAVELRALTELIGMGARGYRALQRLIRTGALALVCYERITPTALVRKEVMQ